MRLPPYGKALQAAREAGQHPDRVYVFFARRFPKVNRCRPHLVVPADDYQPGRYAWWLVRGVPVVLVALAAPEAEMLPLIMRQRSLNRQLLRMDWSIRTEKQQALNDEWQSLEPSWLRLFDDFFTLAVEISRFTAPVTLVAPAEWVHPLYLSSIEGNTDDKWDKAERLKLVYSVADAGSALYLQGTQRADGSVDWHTSPYGWTDDDLDRYYDRYYKEINEYGKQKPLPAELRALTGAQFDVAA